MTSVGLCLQLPRCNWVFAWAGQCRWAGCKKEAAVEFQSELAGRRAVRCQNRMAGRRGIGRRRVLMVQQLTGMALRPICCMLVTLLSHGLDADPAQDARQNSQGSCTGLRDAKGCKKKDIRLLLDPLGQSGSMANPSTKEAIHIQSSATSCMVSTHAQFELS